jgi:hypothetical protein
LDCISLSFSEVNIPVRKFRRIKVGDFCYWNVGTHGMVLANVDTFVVRVYIIQERGFARARAPNDGRQCHGSMFF